MRIMGNISSLTKLTPDATLAQITDADRRAGELLESIGLKVSEHENQSLRSVCQQRQWNEVEVLRWIKKQHQQTSGDSGKADFGSDLSKWSKHLKKQYHVANLELLKEIRMGLPRVHQIHGNQYTWIKNMQWHFERFDEAIRMYYEFETKQLYPLIEKFQKSKGDFLDGTVRKLERYVDIMEKDQERLQRFMKTLTVNSNYFQNPGGACSTLRILNHDFEKLFNQINTQFTIEKEKMIPIIQEKVEGIYL